MGWNFQTLSKIVKIQILIAIFDVVKQSSQNLQIDLASENFPLFSIVLQNLVSLELINQFSHNRVCGIENTWYNWVEN